MLSEFLRVLWRGGAWAYYWRIKPDGGKETLWFKADAPRPVPAAWAGSNVYLGVNTTAQIGTAHTRALAAPDPDKPHAPAVTRVGALFCEWDAKDFGGSKEAIPAHIDALWSQGKGLPWPSVLIDSGGGYHGYWLLAEPLPVGDANRDQVRAVQARWVALWGGDGAAKDLARVLRLPGTENVKYDPPRPVGFHPDSSIGRVYRWADLLEWLPAPAAAPVREQKAAIVRTAQPTPGGAVPAAWVEHQIEKVRHAPEGRRNYTTNQVAYMLGQLVGGGVLDEGGLMERITDAAKAAGLPEHEAKKEAAGGLADGRKNPREEEEQQSGPPEPPPPPFPDDGALLQTEPHRTEHRPEPRPEPRHDRRPLTAAELLSAVFPEPRWAVPGLLPVGLASLGARPKIGKSWLGLQVAIAVGSGGTVFGERVERRPVLYLALEDNERRMQDRMRKQGATAETLIDFHFEIAPLAGEGAVDLRRMVQHAGYGLVVIDTFGRALGRADQNDLAAMTVASGVLQRLALDSDMLILLIDHHKKAAAGGAGDVIDDIMGSTGKSGALDVALGLYRARGQREAVLKLTGRDIEERDLAVNFDRETFCWQLLGTAGEVRADTVQAEILSALEELGGKSNAAAIARFLDKRPHNVSRELQELATAGRVIRGGRDGKTVTYTLPKEPR